MNGPVCQIEDGASIQIRVVPNAKKNMVDGAYGDRIKIRLHAPPVEGKANKQLISFISKLLKVRKSQCTIVKGETSRDKVLKITGVKREQVREALLGPL